MRSIENTKNDFEVLRQAINEAILKNRKVAKIIEKMKDNDNLSDLCNYELILKLRKIVSHFQKKSRNRKSRRN
jgi:hypothetical protein